MVLVETGNINKGRGFSLIELLVVIGIIIMLMAIILPVLSDARDRSRRIVCMSNLKEIGVATFFYAEDHDDSLPNNLDSDHPYTAYNEIYSFSNGKAKPLKLACLYVEGLIDPRLFYCPSSNTKYKDYCDPEPWGTLPQNINMPPLGNGNQWIRTSYYYYPQSTKTDSMGFPEVADKITILDHRKSMVTDNMWTWSEVPHFTGSQRNIRKVICAVFGDGHTAACTNGEAFAPELWFRDTTLPNYAVQGNYKTIRPNSVEFKEILSRLKK